MTHFVKLYGSILTSSIWAEDAATRLVWITMLAMADADGFVKTSASGLARTANVSAVDCRKALKVLEGPDAESGNKNYGGRRIDPTEGGWVLLNYKTYRDFRTREQVLKAERQARWRAKQPSPGDAGGRLQDTERRVDVEVEVEVDGEGNKCKSTDLVLVEPTKAHPVPVSEIMKTMKNLSTRGVSARELELAQATALFAYYTAITGKQHATTMWTKERFTRLRDHIRQRGIDFCLYVVDGGVHHPDLNQPEKGRKHWDLDSFFPLNNAGRLEKLAEITAHGRKPHPILVEHPELLGEEGSHA